MSFDPNQLLTLPEAQAIDETLLPAQERFLIRVALYSLRYLQTLQRSQGLAWAEINETSIGEYVRQDSQIIAAEAQRPGFSQWYCQFLLSSLAQLQQAATQANISIDELSLQHIIDWFTAQAKARLQPD